jgi:hypothetical protein
MPLFAIVSLENPTDALDEAVQNKYPKHFKVRNGHWVLVADGTAQTISDSLGIRGGGLGLVVVYNFVGYYGYATTSLWEWLRTNGNS